MKITKTTVNATSRKLNATWTLDTSNLSISLKEPKSIQEAIDEEIAEALLYATGWIKIKCTIPTENREEVDAWLKDNCKKAYKRFYSACLFQSKKDAVWFALRWVNDPE